MRDYAADFHAALTAALPDGDYVRQPVAEKLVANLLETDRDLLVGWLLEAAPSIVSEQMRHLDASRRAKTRTAGARFAAVLAAADHDGAALADVFAARFTVDAEHTTRRLGDMTGADHQYVATSYEAVEVRVRLLAAFHRAVAARVGSRRTEEVMSEAEYVRLQASITGPARP